MKINSNANSFTNQRKYEQGRIHGHQLRTGGQGGYARFPNFRLVLMDRRTDQRTDGRTKPLIESRVCG